MRYPVQNPDTTLRVPLQSPKGAGRTGLGYTPFPYLAGGHDRQPPPIELHSLHTVRAVMSAGHVTSSK